MKIFLSHASDQKAQAEQIAFSLRSRGHSVFLDRDDLPPAKSFDEQIEKGVASSDFMVFLISPASVAKGRYTLTELEYARRKWGRPHSRVLPVMAEPTDLALVPQFLKAVTILEPHGNLAAEVSSAVQLGADAAHSQTILRFALLGLVSGLLSWGSGFVPLAKKLFFLSTPLVPGFVFGAALCGAILWATGSMRRLAVTFFVVQVAWISAVNVAFIVHGEFDVQTRSSRTASFQTDEQESDEPREAVENASSKLKIDSKMILPGLTAGAVGATGTWLAAGASAPALLSASAAALIVFVGSLTGLALVIDAFPLLYMLWQSSVAATIGGLIRRARD